MSKLESYFFYESLANLIKKGFINLRRRWAWHTKLEIYLIFVLYRGTFMSNFVSLSFVIPEICVFIQNSQKNMEKSPRS